MTRPVHSASRTAPGLTRCFLPIALALSAVATVRATESISSLAGRAQFPGAGRFSVSAGTGVPWVAASEIAYGFTDTFAAGILAGTTPRSFGAGLRLRGRLYRGEQSAVILSVPVVYYPELGKGPEEPWLFALPALVFEMALGQSLCVRGGLGMAASACADALFPAMNEGGRLEAGVWMGSFWNTVTAGTSYALGRSTFVSVDASAILSGMRPAANWYTSVPLLVVASVTRNI